jgi:hypothetical protein
VRPLSWSQLAGILGVERSHPSARNKTLPFAHEGQLGCTELRLGRRVPTREGCLDEARVAGEVGPLVARNSCKSTSCSDREICVQLHAL